MKMDQLIRLSKDKITITTSPVRLYEMGNLTVLELAHNGLDEIPEKISGIYRVT